MTMRQLLKLRDFRLLWLGQTLSVFGDALADMALLILVNRLTGSVAAVATMAIVMAVPQVVFGLLAGVFVDRWDRKRLMLVSDVLRGLLVLGFILVASAEQIWLLYLLGFLQALVGVFFLPARSALIPQLVPQEGLLAANSLNQTSEIIAGLLGAAAAGVLFAVLNAPWIAFVIDSLTFFVSVALLALMRVPRRERPTNPASVGVVLGELQAGLGLIARSRVLLGVLVAAGVAMLGFGAVNVLLVPLVVNELRVPETWFAGLQGAQTASMVMSGGLVALLAARFRPTSIVSVAMLSLGALVALISLVNTPWQLALILFAVGWFMIPLQASLATLTQTAVSDEVRGRVGAALSTLTSTASLLSMAFAGAFGAWLGVRNVFVLGGIIAMLAGLGAALLFRGTAVARRVVAGA